MDLDDLCQEAAENRIARHAARLRAVAICAEAVRMGKAAIGAVAEHIGYKSNTVKKLAVEEPLPPELIDLDAQPGMYWVASLNTDSYEEYEAAIRRALAENVTTPAGMKKLLGLEEEKDSGKWINNKGLLTSIDGQYLTVFIEDGWQPSGDVPATVKVTG